MVKIGETLTDTAVEIWDVDRIQRWLLGENWHRSQICAINVFYWGGYETDFLRITEAGYAHEYEIKLTRSDFLADKRKSGFMQKLTDRGFWTTDYSRDDMRKHDALAQGKGRVKSFTFVTAYGIVKEEDIPEHCGWMEVEKDGTGIDTKKYAPNLPRPVKASGRDMRLLTSKLCWRWYQLWMSK